MTTEVKYLMVHKDVKEVVWVFGDGGKVVIKGDVEQMMLVEVKI